jgi:hypothetical protein
VRLKSYIGFLLFLFITVGSLGLFLPHFLAERSDPVGEFSPRIATPTATQGQAGIIFQPENPVDPTPTKIILQNTNCTYHYYFWMGRPDSWPAEIIMGNVSYTRDDLFDVISLESEDTSTRLIQQLFATFLNVLYGSDVTSVKTVIEDSNNWLVSHPPGSQLSEFNHQRGRTLISLLAGYNEGAFGPGTCSDVPPTPDLTASVIPTETPLPPTPTPTQTPVLPSRTPAPSRLQPGPTSTPAATSTSPPSPTPIAPVQPTSTPMHTPTIEPTPTLPIPIPPIPTVVITP